MIEFAYGFESQCVEQLHLGVPDGHCQSASIRRNRQIRKVIGSQTSLTDNLASLEIPDSHFRLKWGTDASDELAVRQQRQAEYSEYCVLHWPERPELVPAARF